ncbi:MAG: multiubiquitin domain-containing protein [Devosia sp.]|uniref:multiubiquitin domain-containing protein n=1 Tax=Devosia sp. TaxID=1871048 RepID=UPI001A44B9AB|nr:multiubiquitin domain-containing protein [Devosia sp.]MBL8596421.1 multiubiquitin domain-containing protein [Devosia sp.]
MTTEDPAAQSRSNNRTSIEVAGTDLVFRSVEVPTNSPTGGQIAKAAGFTVDQHPYVLQWRPDGDLEDIRPQEDADLAHGTKFIVAESSNSNRITIDDEQIDWPADVISGAVVRKLGKIPADKDIYLEREDDPDRLVNDTDVIKIKGDGVEEFKSRKPAQKWELDVQGKRIVSSVPVISVVDAMTQAGFDPNAWIIILRVQGEPKRQLEVGDSIDLSKPGIEKIRLTAKDVNNGEAQTAPRREFALLATDEDYLDALGLIWETETAGKRWLIIHDYPLPPGYTASKVTLALLIPPTYPQAQIDMFYVHPTLHLTTGRAIPAAQTQVAIRGLSFQRWSRHRGPASKWNPVADNVMTHLALVETAIAKEVGE